MRRDGRAEAAVALQERQRGRRKLGTEFALAAPPFFLLLPRASLIYLDDYTETSKN